MSPAVIGIVVVLVIALVYFFFVWRKKHAGGSLRKSLFDQVVKLSGIDYAGCDGNYVWTGKTSDGNYLVFNPAKTMASGQVGRTVTVDKSGLLECRAEGQTTGAWFGRATVPESTKVKFPFSAQLWDA